MASSRSQYAHSIAPSVATSFVDTSVGREYFYEAKKCVASKQYLKAKRLFKFVIQLRPDAASPHYHLGCVLVELNALEEAVSHFKKATNIKPDVIKYQQFYTWYSMLYHCKYNDGQTPGGPNNNRKRNRNNDDDDDDDDDEEEKDDEKNESDSTGEDDDDDVDLKDITDYNNEYYQVNKAQFSKYSIHKLLKEFCPSKFHLKSNATLKQTLNILNQAINLYDPKKNENKHNIYYEYNTKRYPDLNQKHLYQLLCHHKDLLIKREKNIKTKKKLIKNSKKYSKCPYCFVPRDVICEHKIKRKGGQKNMGKTFNQHKYKYCFEQFEDKKNQKRKK